MRRRCSLYDVTFYGAHCQKEASYLFRIFDEFDKLVF